MSDWIVFLSTQIFQLPFLVLYIVGLIFALGRRDMGKAATYATAGFALLILSTLISAAQQYLMMTMRTSGEFDVHRVSTIAMGFGIPSTVCRFAGVGLLMAAIFARRPAAPLVQ